MKILDVYARSGQKFKSTSRHDPYRNFNFEVIFSGKRAIFSTGWNHVSGILASHGYTEHREGGNNGVAETFQEEVTYEPIIMSRGVSEDDSVLKAFAGQWDKNGFGVMIKDRYTVTIKIKDRDMKKVVKTYKLYNAWISSLDTGELDAQGAEVLINSITVNYSDVDFS